MHEPVLARLDRGDAHGLLQLEDKAGANRADDVRGSAFLPMLDVGQEVVTDGVDVGHRSPTGNVRDTVGEQRAPGHQNTGRARASDQLVG